MSHNTFGHLFRVTTWGESHGPALGCVVDGMPPGIRFSRADIQAELYGKPGPALTAVRVTGFAFEDLLIEIEAMAVTRD